MLSDLQLAARNLLRNRRRSLTTVAAIAVGCVAMVVFGGFISAVSLGLETSIARQEGHLHLYSQGYLDYGAANPTDFAIDQPDKVLEGLLANPALKEQLVMAAPLVRLNGIAGNFAEQASKTFAGVGVIPSRQRQMAQWDSHGLGGTAPLWHLDDGDADGAIIGIGMARMLNLCDELSLIECHDQAKKAPVEPEDTAIAQISASIGQHRPDASQRPRLDLLAATSEGAPNVVSVQVNAGIRQAVRTADDMFVGMHLAKAQQLVFGGADKVTAIVLQLRSLTATPTVRELLEKHLSHWPQRLEVRELGEFNPTFTGILTMFRAIFAFVSGVITVVVLFPVANTMTMNVLERTAEIGTLRAMGVRRAGIRHLFLQEGLLLGIAGASLGVLLGIVAAQTINMAGLSWQPPSNPVPQPLVLMPLAEPVLPLLVWLTMIGMTVLSALPPANRAARLTIVDAIHHV